MKIIYIITLFLYFVAIPSISLSESFYVAQESAGKGNGSSYANRMSVFTHNRTKFNPGDVIYLSGTITSEITVNSSGSAEDGYIIYDGYESGNCDQINSECTESALIERNNKATGVRGIYALSKDYIIIQDLRIKKAGHGIYFEGSIAGSCDYITVRRVWIEEMYNIGIEFGSIMRFKGCAYATLEDSVIVDIAEGRNTSAVSHVNLDQSSDVVIRRCHIYNRDTYKPVGNGTDGIVGHGTQGLLVEYCRIHRHGEDGIDFKLDGPRKNKDLIFRFNDVYDTLQSPVQIQGEGNNAYIYGNRIHEANRPKKDWYGILVTRGFEDVFIWSNLIFKNDGAGVSVYSHDDKHPYRVFIYNNTFVANGFNADSGSASQMGGVRLLGAPHDLYKHEVKNNIFYGNQPKFNMQTYISASMINDVIIDYNLYYYRTNIDPKIRFGGVNDIYSLTDLYIINTPFYRKKGQEKHGMVGDPKFEDATNNNYRLTASSNYAIDKGAVLTNPATWNPPTIQGVDYSNLISLEDALDPANTNWATIPPKVATVKQGDFGSAWEIGAYAYLGFRHRLNPPRNIRTSQ